MSKRRNKNSEDGVSLGSIGAWLWVGIITPVIAAILAAYFLAYVPPGKPEPSDNTLSSDIKELARVLREDSERRIKANEVAKRELKGPATSGGDLPENSASPIADKQVAEIDADVARNGQRTSIARSDVSKKIKAIVPEAKSPNPNASQITPTTSQPASGNPDSPSNGDQLASLPDKGDILPTDDIEDITVEKSPDFQETKIVVFEGQKFPLCRYSDFTAEIQGSNIVLASRDRDIPGRTFRGFQKKVPAEVQTTLFDNCIVLASYYETSGTIRIGLLVKERLNP